MIWNTIHRQKAIDLHSQGWSDREMSEYFGVTRPQMASYRANCLKLPSNNGRRARGPLIECAQCGKRYSQSRLRRHMIHDHHSPVKKRGPRSRKECMLTILHGRGGYFDSAKLLDILTTRREAA